MIILVILLTSYQTSTVVSCHDDQIFISENFEDVEQTDRLASDSFRSAEVEEDSLPFPDLQGLSNLQLEHENHDHECVDAVIDTCHGSFDLNNSEDLNLRFGSAAYVMGSSHFFCKQRQIAADFCRKGSIKVQIRN
jgi:hypothetical protein